jgi:hypothetical protein
MGKFVRAPFKLPEGMRKIEPYTDKWERLADKVARSYAPEMIACAACGRPTPEGYICYHCSCPSPTTGLVWVEQK